MSYLTRCPQGHSCPAPVPTREVGLGVEAGDGLVRVGNPGPKNDELAGILTAPGLVRALEQESDADQETAVPIGHAIWTGDRR